ncbi:MAG: cupin domain-containing protein [Actinomycetota bacterium]
MDYVFSLREIEVTDFEDRLVKFAFGSQGREKTDTLNLGIVEFKTNQKASPHTHDVDEALYVLSGRGRIKIDGNYSGIREGDFALIPSGKSHLIETDRQNRLKILFVFGGKTYIDY